MNDTSFDTVLSLLANSSSANPIADFDLLQKYEGALNMTIVLDTLYDRRQVQRAKMIKDGREYMAYWKTGVVVKYDQSSRARFDIKPRDEHSAPTPKRTPNMLETAPAATVSKTETHDTPAAVKRSAKAKKGLAFDIVNHVIVNNQVRRADLLDEFGKGNYSRDDVCKSLYNLIQNKTLCKDGKHLRVGENANKYLALKGVKDLLGNAKKAPDVYEIPAFLKHTAGDSSEQTEAIPEFPAKQDAPHTQADVASTTPRPIESFDRTAHKSIDAAPESVKLALSAMADDLSAQGALQNHLAGVASQPMSKPKFRIAYTNDGCLMLMGVSGYVNTIELNVEQSRDLVSFISALDLEAQS